jgi:hypothetical protein
MINLDDEVKLTDNQIKNFDSKKLCAIVVTYKYFNTNMEVAEKCMVELCLRRKNGDMFVFEDFIQSEFDKLPKYSDNKYDIRNIIKMFKK